MDNAKNKQIQFLPATSEDKFLDIDFLFSIVNQANSSLMIIDLDRAEFITPSRAIALVLACRHIYSTTKQKVLLRNVSRTVQKYFLRMDMPIRAQKWLEIEDLGIDEWGRKPNTSQLLEMTKIGSTADVEYAIDRAGNIFSQWLNKSDLNNLLSSLSELCSNVYQHSTDDDGIVLIQKYEKQTLHLVNIQVAVGDLGCGIRGSLETRYGKLASSAIDYLKLAMEGKSSRNTGRGGLGLRRVEQILQTNLGSLHLRTHDASILSHYKTGREYVSGIPFFPGTQIALGLNFPLPKSL